MIKLKTKSIKFILFILAIAFLFIFEKSNYITLKNTTQDFLTSVLPSLFPFILFTNIITECNLISSFTSILKKYSNLISVIIIGFLCGYPMGAKTTYNYYTKKLITKSQAYFLMTFSNNCNPIFILSTIGICVLNNTNIAIILCISHYLSAICIGIVYFLHNNIIHENVEKSNNLSKSFSNDIHKNIFDAISDSIKSTFLVLGNIFAFIAIFNLAFSIIKTILLKLNVNSNLIYALSGIFEVTSGIKLFFLNSNFSYNLTISIISFFLGFSGSCIIFQVYSCIYKMGIKISYILKYKLIQGMLSFIFTYILMSINTTIDLNTISKPLLNTTPSYYLLFISILFILVYSLKKVTQK